MGGEVRGERRAEPRQLVAKMAGLCRKEKLGEGTSWAGEVYGVRVRRTERSQDPSSTTL